MFANDFRTETDREKGGTDSHNVTGMRTGGQGGGRSPPPPGQKSGLFCTFHGLPGSFFPAERSRISRRKHKKKHIETNKVERTIAASPADRVKIKLL